MIISVAVWRIYPSWVNDKLWALEGLSHSGMLWARLSGDDFRSKLEIISFLFWVMFISKFFSFPRAFAKFGAKRSSPGAFGFDDVLELFLKTALRYFLENSDYDPPRFSAAGMVRMKNHEKSGWVHWISNPGHVLTSGCGGTPGRARTFISDRSKKVSQDRERRRKLHRCIQTAIDSVRRDWSSARRDWRLFFYTFQPSFVTSWPISTNKPSLESLKSQKSDGAIFVPVSPRERTIAPFLRWVLTLSAQFPRILTCSGQINLYRGEIAVTTSIFWNFFSFSKQSRCYFPDSYGGPQAEQIPLVMIRRKLEWKRDFQALARSSAEGPSIVVAFSSSRLRWSMVQKRKNPANTACDCPLSSTKTSEETSEFWGAFFRDRMFLPFCCLLFSCMWQYSSPLVRLQIEDSKEKQSSVTLPVLISEP